MGKLNDGLKLSRKAKRDSESIRNEMNKKEPRKLPDGMSLSTFLIGSELYEKFKNLCKSKGITVSDELRGHIEACVESDSISYGR